MGQKRSREGDDSSRKKDKRCYLQDHWTTKGNALPFGSQGIMVTIDNCDSRKGQNEAINVFEEAWEELMEARKASEDKSGQEENDKSEEQADKQTTKDEKVEPLPHPEGAEEAGKKPDAKDEETAEPENFDSLISSEVKDIKSNKKKPFVPHDTGIKTCLFLKMPLVTDSTPGPCEVVEHVLREAKKTKTLRFRFCARILPFTYICKPTIEEISSAAATAVSKCPECGENAESTTVAVLYEHRAAPKDVDRTKLIDEVIAHVKRPPHTVKLKGASKTICVQVIRNACGVAILNDYHDLSRYNVKEICKPAE